MNVLIVINDLSSGGAQKSLSSFLKALKEQGLLYKYNIDLLVAQKKGIFVEDIPVEVNVIEAPKYFKWMNCELSDIDFIKDFSILGIYGKILTILKKRLKLNDDKGRSAFWYSWKNLIPTNKKEYDVAIAYMDGWPNYYVSQKVKSIKKVLWVHNEYQKLGYYKPLDEECYKACNQVITISEDCKASFIEAFHECKDKIDVLENITLTSDINNKANMGVADEFVGIDNDTLKILSIGRLTEQKAFDLAIKAAFVLKKSGTVFKWVILGEGPDREKLEKLITENGLEDCFIMPGIKSNPYVYIKACDIFVQSSIYEGKSIVLDEAKVLAKPIVVTNYKTVHASITNEKNGLIVEMTPDSVAEGIIRLLPGTELRNNIVAELETNNRGNEKELKKYLELML